MTRGVSGSSRSRGVYLVVIRHRGRGTALVVSGHLMVLSVGIASVEGNSGVAGAVEELKAVIFSLLLRAGMSGVSKPWLEKKSTQTKAVWQL